MLHLFKTKPIAFMPLLLGLVEGSSTLWHHLGWHCCPCLPKCSISNSIVVFAGVQLPEVPLASLGCFWNQPLSVLLSPFPPFSFSVLPQCRVLAFLDPCMELCQALTLGLVFAAFHENSAENIYIFLNR